MADKENIPIRKLTSEEQRVVAPAVAFRGIRREDGTMQTSGDGRDLPEDVQRALRAFLSLPGGTRVASGGESEGFVIRES